MQGMTLSGTQITGGHISTTATGADGKAASVEMFNTAQFDKPSGAHSVVTASDGTQWYQMASGAGAGAFYSTPSFAGSADEAGRVMETFPGAEAGTVLRSIGVGEIAASTPDGETMWYNSAYYDEPKAPHSVMQTSDGVDWYAMKPNAEIPSFEAGDAATDYNQALFGNFMPGYEQPITNVDASNADNGYFEVRHEDGSGTRFYDAVQYQVPRGDYQSYEDSNGNSWYGVHGDAAVERRPVYENGQPVYDGDRLRTVNVSCVHYKNTPSAYGTPVAHEIGEHRAPNRRRL